MLSHTRLNWYPRITTIALALLVFTAPVAHGASVGNVGSETEEILTAMIPLAKEMLEKHGQFAPYGCAMTLDGKVVTVAESSGTKPPPSEEIITALQTDFRAGALTGKYKATGLFSDVEVVPPGATEKTHAIEAALDHKQDNYSVLIYFPYKIVAGKVQFEEVFASPGANKVFQK